jgi:Fatty acid desaturase
MDHREFVATLPADLREAMTTRSDWPGLRHLGLHLGAILALGGLIAAGVPGWWLLVPVQGVLIIALFMLEHEATHRTPFARPWLNDGAGRLAGVLLLLPFEWFRYFHLAHHRWTNIAGRDPELQAEKPATRRAWALHVSGLPYWGSQLRLMAALIRGRAVGDYLPDGAKGRIVAEARWMALSYAVLGSSLLWTPLLLWVWVLPVLLGQPFLRIYLLAEHGDCPAGGEHVRKHPDDLYHTGGAVAGVEHALSRRTPCLACRPVSPPARGAPADARRVAGNGRGVCGVHEGLSGAAPMKQSGIRRSPLRSPARPSPLGSTSGASPRGPRDIWGRESGRLCGAQDWRGGRLWLSLGVEHERHALSAPQ